MEVVVLPSDDTVVIVEDKTYVSTFAVNQSVNTIAGVQGLQGADGLSSSGGAIAHRFSWGDAPQLITTVPAGGTVFKVELVLLTAFNVPSSLAVGDSLDAGRLFNVPNLDLTQAGTYETNPNFTCDTQTEAALHITLGIGVQAGSGIILIYIQA